MAVGIGVAILTKVAEYLVAPIGHQLSYLLRYNRNVQDFQNQVEKLGDMRDRMQQSVNTATRDGEDIKTDVQKWLTKVDEIMAEADDLDDKVKMHRRCLNGLCPDWGSRYKLSKEVMKKKEIVSELQRNGQIENVSVPAPPLNIAFIPNKDFITVEASKSTVDKIIEALQDDNCDMVGVYGMGGIGKTTLVKEVGKRAKDYNLFDQVVMAVVSQTPNLRKIQGQVADMLGLKLSDESEFGRAGRLYARLKNEKRILVILDDVWARVDLAAIGIPHGAKHKGCKVILTTRREDVCSAMGRRTKKIPLNLLSMDESWTLFRENAGAIVDSSTLNGVALEVARECRGLPLALVTVGRALQDKEIGEWKTALQLLKKSNPLNMDEAEQDVFSCLKLSYDYLKSEEIKVCFLFCCLFPEDYDIKIEDLARFGMGKGFFGDADTMEEARSEAHAITKYLKASCLLLDSDTEGCVKMHDVVRDVAISIASRDNSIFLVRAGLGLKDWPKKQTFEHYTDISLMSNDIQKLPAMLKCPKLQVLLLGENEGFDKIPNAFFEGMPELKVLDLSEKIGIRSLLPGTASIPSISLPSRFLTLPPSLEFLANLRTLHLDNCMLGNISVIGKLKKLEILSFYGSDIKQLPKEIAELDNLRLLDLSFCQYLQTIPANVISKLSQLEELYMGGSFRQWAVEGIGEERNKASLSELKSLARLVNLCVELETMACFPTDLVLHELPKYAISIGCDSIKCYPNSRSIHLREIHAPLSDEVKALVRNAEEATLFCLMEDSMSDVLDIDGQGLNCLKSLKVSACMNMYSLARTRKWSITPAIFTGLEELHLRHMGSMFGVISDSFPAASLQKLRVLEIQFCGELLCPLPFSVLLRLQNLKEVDIENCEKVISIFHRPRENEENFVVFSTLRKLSLARLPELHSIWHAGLSELVNLNNLTVVEISSCDSLRYVFSYPVAQTLSQLETLKIKRCQRLQRIVGEAKEGVSTNHILPVGLPNLKIVQLEKCEGLTSLFSVSTDEEFLLPKLDSLQLKSLPSLNRLCSDGFTVGMPSLAELIMEKCHGMENFAADPVAYGLQSAPKLMKLQVDGQTLDGMTVQDLFG